MVVVCIILGVLIAVCVVTIMALLRAKDGFEDAAGFHVVVPASGAKATAATRQIKVQAASRRSVPAGLGIATD